MRSDHIVVFGMLVASAVVASATDAGAEFPSLPAASDPSSSNPGPSGPAGASLVDRVRHEMRMLPYYSVFDDLSFRVDDSTVILMGQVTRPVLKTDAEAAVKHLAGVTKVDNQIEVLPLSDFDHQIRLKTYFAIYGFGPLQRYGLGSWPSIHILVKNGQVTLKGVVDSEADRNLVYIRANQVPGVFSVTNGLLVDKQS
jgi:hyperosmotically inducible protein